MAGSRRVEQVTCQHRVELETCERDAVTREHEDVEFQVVPHLLQRRIFEKRAQALEGAPAIELVRSAGARKKVVAAAIGSLMSDRDIARLAVARREREAHD